MEISLIESFERTVEENKGKTALSFEGESLTFYELRKASHLFAQFIAISFNLAANKPIAVFLPKSIDVVVSDISCMYNACPFMNLDVKTPLKRIMNILDLVKPQLIVTDATHIGTFTNIGLRIPIIDVSASCDDSIAGGNTVLEKCLSAQVDTDPVCIINTSGSTGTPKSVVLSHRGFFDFLEWSIQAFSFNGSEVLGSLSPVVFDIFDFEMFLMMYKGSSVVLLDNAKAAFPVLLLKELKERDVNFLFWVPSIMVTIANMDLLSSVDLTQLRLVWFAGEVFPTKQFNYWRKSLPSTLFANLYGPIEITLDCTFYIVDREIPDDEPIPIGYPCRNTDILILDDQDRPCATGEKGELCVRGTSLALGYYNNPEKTAAAFTQNPLNSSYPELIYRTGDIVSRDDEGIIHFNGRKDSLIKHMGYRIELGEIEHIVTNTLEIAKYCCVVYNSESKDIILFYEGSNDFDLVDVRRRISEVLPKYMMPTRYERMVELPRNTNGKIDRAYLSSLAVTK